MPGTSNYRPHCAWRCWYHCTANTYGTWLPGDPRGFRTRHHREHIQGDYKRPPPPGAHAKRHEHAKRLMNQDAVVLSREAQRLVFDSMLKAFEIHRIDVAAFALTPIHLHLLARFPPGLLPPRSPGIGIPGRPPAIPGSQRTSSKDDPPRHYLGIAKKQSTRALSQAGLKPPGRTWATRGKVVPVRSADHFVYLRDTYLPDHVAQGALLHHDLQIVP